MGDSNYAKLGSFASIVLPSYCNIQADIRADIRAALMTIIIQSRIYKLDHNNSNMHTVDGIHRGSDSIVYYKIYM